MKAGALPIVIDRDAVAAFCRARGIRKLSLFGSVLRDDFDPVRSDVDVLAEFEPEAHPGLKFFGYGDEEIFGARRRDETVADPPRRGRRLGLRSAADFLLRSWHAGNGISGR